MITATFIPATTSLPLTDCRPNACGQAVGNWSRAALLND